MKLMKKSLSKQPKYRQNRSVTMQKKPMYRSSRPVLLLMAAASSMPVVVTSANAGESGYRSSGLSGIAQREMIRRQEAVADADRLLNEGREAYAKGDYQQAVDKYRQALGRLPDAPMVADRRRAYLDNLGDASVALAQHFRKVGKYTEARALLEEVLSPEMDPNNAAAKVELGYLDDPIRTNPALDYEHTQNVDKVRRGLYMAEGNYNLGKYDDAKREYENVIRIDPYNSAARRGMERVAQAKSDYYRAAYDQTRAELLMQVDAMWELAIPVDPPEFRGTSGSIEGSDGVAYITEKLRRIIIPVISFEESTTLEEAIDFLRQRATELDITEPDPTRRGVNFVIRRPRPAGGGAPVVDAGLDVGTEEGLPFAGGDPGSLRVGALRIRNVPLAVALKYIADATKLRYKVDDFAVTLVPQTDTVDELFSRTFRVPPDFYAVLSGGGDNTSTTVDDPFAAPAGPTGAVLKPREPITDLLKKAGVNFVDGSSANLSSNGVLMITNTPNELDKIEQLVMEIGRSQPKQVKITTKFIEITQNNGEELGFDWIVSPFGLTANNLFLGGGTVGNGTPRTNADFQNPVNFTNIPGIPADAGVNVNNTLTGGLRSGDSAIVGNSINSILNNPSRSAQSGSVAPGIMALTGLFTDGQVQMIMRGLSQRRGTDLMTAPSVMARSGQKANIEIIREFIYPTEYEPPEIPQQFGGNNNQGDGVAVGGGNGGGFPVTPANPTAFETRNTGVTLEIEPTIGENDFVIDLRFVPEIVEFEGFINYGSPIQAAGSDALGNPTQITITDNRIEMPVFSVRRVNTSLTIYDGYTVAVGGLMREDVQNVEDKVPILGDIPIIGRLFQTKAENRIKSNLIIFVTAQIVDATGRPLRGADGESFSVPTTTTEVSTDGVLPPL